jgi:hypothetical protein
MKKIVLIPVLTVVLFALQAGIVLALTANDGFAPNANSNVLSIAAQQIQPSIRMRTTMLMP